MGTDSKGHEGIWGLIEMFYVLIFVMVTQPHGFIRTHRIVH